MFRVERSIVVQVPANEADFEDVEVPPYDDPAWTTDVRTLDHEEILPC